MSSIFDNYTVLGTLGEGAFGIVKRVENKETGQTFAMKEFKKDIQDDIKKEIKVLKDIGNHRNIVELIHILFDSERTALLFEFCELGDLDSYIRKNWGTPIRPLMGDMICGLKFLHGKGLAHRDLKPANILLVPSSNGTVPTCKIADFGLAKFVNRSVEEFSITGGSYLSTYCGTPFYMAPEVGKVTYKKVCDIFSLGAIFFVLFSKQTLGSGKQAFLAPTIEEKQLRDATDQQIESAVQKLGGFREMIIMMLKQDYRERADIDTIYHVYQSN